MKKKMSNTSSSGGSNSLQHFSISSESASTDHTPSPPPSPVHHPLPFPIHPLPPQIFIPKEVVPFNWSDEKGEDFEELRLVAEDAVTTTFLRAPIRHKRRRRLGRSSSESSILGLSDSQKADSSDNSSKDSSDGSDSRDDEGEEEKKEGDDDDEMMEYLPLDYPQEDSRDDTVAYAPMSP